jgi:hypothetical protein
MVKFISNPQSDEKIINRSLLVVELAGLAWARKLILSRELNRRNGTIRMVDPTSAPEVNIFFLWADQKYLEILIIFISSL